MTDWTALPWQSLVTVASGYAAYLLAFTGLRAAHKAIDTALASLVFGLLSAAVIWIGARYDWHDLLTGALAVVAALIAAIIWRKWLRYWTRDLLHHYDISWSNEEPTAWHMIIGDERHPITELAVQLTDKSWLYCHDAWEFNKKPHGPCILGADGSIALYVTHTRRSETDDEEKDEHVLNEAYGARFTFVPAAHIRQIDLRYSD